MFRPRSVVRRIFFGLAVQQRRDECEDREGGYDAKAEARHVERTVTDAVPASSCLRNWLRLFSEGPFVLATNDRI